MSDIFKRSHFNNENFPSNFLNKNMFHLEGAEVIRCLKKHFKEFSLKNGVLFRLKGYTLLIYKVLNHL